MLDQNRITKDKINESRANLRLPLLEITDDEKKEQEEINEAFDFFYRTNCD